MVMVLMLMLTVAPVLSPVRVQLRVLRAATSLHSAFALQQASPHMMMTEHSTDPRLKSKLQVRGDPATLMMML